MGNIFLKFLENIQKFSVEYKNVTFKSEWKFSNIVSYSKFSISDRISRDSFAKILHNFIFVDFRKNIKLIENLKERLTTCLNIA